MDLFYQYYQLYKLGLLKAENVVNVEDLCKYTVIGSGCGDINLFEVLLAYALWLYSIFFEKNCFEHALN